MSAFRRGWILGILFAATLAFAGSARLSGQAQPTLDGTVNDEEWKGASSHALEGGGTVQLLTRANLIYFGIRGPSEGIAHLCVATGDDVRILHVSAAVGSARFRQADGKWTQPSPFTWSLRDPGLTGAAADARAAYLQKEGWVGTVSRMGRNTDREVVIDRSRFGQGPLRVVVAYLAMAGNALGTVSHWPNVRDSCTEQRTVAGFLPDGPQFRVNEWSLVE
jgi:hypothetical protein